MINNKNNNNNNTKWLFQILSVANTHSNALCFTHTETEFPELLESSFNFIKEIQQDIGSSKQEDEKISQKKEFLFLAENLLLQFLQPSNTNDDYSDLSDLLDDLQQCYQHWFIPQTKGSKNDSKSTKKNRKNKKEEEKEEENGSFVNPSSSISFQMMVLSNHPTLLAILLELILISILIRMLFNISIFEKAEEEDPEPVIVLTEILVALLANPSSLLRDVVNRGTFISPLFLLLLLVLICFWSVLICSIRFLLFCSVSSLCP